MTLDEAIARLNDKNKHEFVLAPNELTVWFTELKRLREENEKLMSHVCELQLAYNNELVDGKKAKRLLREAVRALNDGSCNKDCRQCENCKSCDYDDRFKWKHTDEAMKLIGEGGDPGD